MARPLRAGAAMACLVEEATKLTLGIPLEVRTPHQVRGVLETEGHDKIAGGHLTKYQARLLDSPEITLKTCQTLNVVTLRLLVKFISSRIRQFHLQVVACQGYQLLPSEDSKPCQQLLVKWPSLFTPL